MPRYLTVIGIDAGVSTGIAVWLSEKQCFRLLTTLDFWNTWDLIRVQYPPSIARLVIEDPSGNAPVFHQHDASGRKRLKLAQNIGSNKREATLLIDGFRRLGYDVTAVTPTSAKWDAETFRRLTKYEGRCSQHARDAGRLVFGMR